MRRRRQPARLAYRLLALALPRSFRHAAGPELEAAALACLDRERDRSGWLGFAWAWVRIALDTIGSAAALRWRSSQNPYLPREATSPPRPRLETVMDQLAQDLRRVWRSLRRQPGFTAVTVLTLAIGLGANSAVFSVVYDVLLRPLPYPESGQLHRITSMFPEQFSSPFPMSEAEFVEFRDNTRAYSSVGAYYVSMATLGADTPERVTRALVTPDLLPTLGVAPVIGRGFTAVDSRPGAADVVVLSWSTWTRLYAGDRSVLGRSIRINDVSYEVVGVMPATFDLLDEQVALLQPLTLDPATFASNRASHYLNLIGRLGDGVTQAQAQADGERLEAEWQDLAPGQHVLNAGHHPLLIEPLDARLGEEARQPLLLLQGAVLLVLLVACANLTNLFLVRADAQVRDYAVRTALGASGRQVFRQMLTEGLLLAALGAGAALVLAQGGLSFLLAINPDGLPRAGGVALDRPVLLVTTLVGVVAAVVMALVPYIRLRTRAVARMVTESGTRAVAGGRSRWRSAMVVAEVALAVLLATGAGLLIRTVSNLTQVDPGFDRSSLTTFSVVLPSSTYDAAERQRFYDTLAERVRAIPGVERVASMTGLPPLRRMNVNDTNFEHIPDDRPHGEPPIENVDYYQTVSVGYIETMGIAVTEGRSFEEADLTGPPVAIINAQLADTFFAGRNPVGGHLKPPWGGGTLPWFTVVGVLDDVKQGGLSAASGTELYLLDGQVARLAEQSASQRYLAVRSTRETASLAPALRDVVRELDAGVPVTSMRSMDEVIDASIAEPRFLTFLLSVFAGLALLLAAVGTYGVLSYLVLARRREFGIRLALGANQRGVLRLVLRNGLLLLVMGLALGLAGTMFTSRLAASLLFDISPSDPATLMGVAGVILGVGLMACLVPAWRATRVDPLIVLRDS